MYHLRLVSALQPSIKTKNHSTLWYRTVVLQSVSLQFTHLKKDDFATRTDQIHRCQRQKLWAKNFCYTRYICYINIIVAIVIIGGLCNQTNNALCLCHSFQRSIKIGFSKAEIITMVFRRKKNQHSWKLTVFIIITLLETGEIFNWTWK